jgi:hypothetical protein
MSETELLWKLRQLPREMDPPRDLWPGIAAGRQRRPARVRRPWLASLSLAASLVLAAGLVYKSPVGAGLGAPLPDPADTLSANVVRGEAAAVTRQYEAALRQFDGAPVPAAVQPELKVLDDSAAQIRRAIAADPDAVFLLQQLRKTYELRLTLTRATASA